MKIKILLLAVLVLGILTVPAAADVGNFSGGDGFNQVHMVPYDPAYGGIVPSFTFHSLYLKEISFFTHFLAVRYYWAPATNLSIHCAPTWTSCSIPSSYLPLTVTDYYAGANQTIGTGTIGFAQSSYDGSTYVYIYLDNWNPGALTGERYLRLNYNDSAWIPRYSRHVLTYNSTWPDNYVTVVSEPANPRWASPITGQEVEYLSSFENGWETIPTIDSNYDQLKIDRFIGGIRYLSHVKINQTDGSGVNHTLMDDYSNVNLALGNVYNKWPVYIEVYDPAGLESYSTILYEQILTTWDLNVFTYDGSSGALYNGATVTKIDLTDPYYNGWGISGVDYPGRIDFQAIQDHEYNLSATAVGMSTGYANYTATTSPSIIKLYLYPDLGYSTLEFKVIDTGDRLITGLPVRLSDGRGKITVAGFARFNSTNGVSYGWTVGDATTSQYVPQTGNVTATTGRTIIVVVMPLVSEIANLTEPTPSSPHVAAQEFMDFIYETVPGLAIVAVVFLFLAMMGFNPAGMAGKRGRR